jgi:hypothetical protein
MIIIKLKNSFNRAPTENRRRQSTAAALGITAERSEVYEQVTATDCIGET